MGGDWTKNNPKVEYPFIQNIYNYYGATAKAENTHFPNEKHGYEYIKRQAMPSVSSEAPRAGFKGCSIKKPGNMGETGNIIETTAQQQTFNSLNEMPKHALKPGTHNAFN